MAKDMALTRCGVNVDDLPLEVLTKVCRHLGLVDLVRVSQSCKRFRHGGLETVELPTESPVVMALRQHAFPRTDLVPRTRPPGCSESWVSYLARCARQRRYREAPPFAVGDEHALYVDASGRLLACGEGAAVGHGDRDVTYFVPTPVAAMAGVRVRRVAAGWYHSLALTWDGRVYSWGGNNYGQLGHGDKLERPSPALVGELEGVRGVTAHSNQSLAVTQSGTVFSWGHAVYGEEHSARPIIVEGFGEGVRVRRVCAGKSAVFAIGEAGELFSWGQGLYGLLGHGDSEDQPSPKRVEALRGVRMSNVSFGRYHALALAEDGLVYAWGENRGGAYLVNPRVARELLPKPVEALRGISVGSVAAVSSFSYAVADTGELWAWSEGSKDATPLGHGEPGNRLMPKPIESLPGVEVDAVTAGCYHTLALAGDGSVYVWGKTYAEQSDALDTGPSVQAARRLVHKPRRVPALRLACGGGFV
jgi:hypothetical protein